MLDVKEFVKKLSENKELANVLSNVTNKDELTAKLKEFGFDLNDEDLLTLKKVLSEAELSEEQLAAVAGGRAVFHLETLQKLCTII